MNRHLVSIEVGVKCRTDEGMELNRPTFDDNWFKGLNSQTVQGWCPIQHHWVSGNYFFEDIPNHRIALLDHLFGGFDIVN